MITAVSLITGNAGKAAEYAHLLGVPVTPVRDELVEIQSLDVEEVVRHKAAQAYRTRRAPVLVDDTALTFDAWRGSAVPHRRHRWLTLLGRWSNERTTPAWPRWRRRLTTTAHPRSPQPYRRPAPARSPRHRAGWAVRRSRPHEGCVTWRTGSSHRTPHHHLAAPWPPVPSRSTPTRPGSRDPVRSPRSLGRPDPAVDRGMGRPRPASPAPRNHPAASGPAHHPSGVDRRRASLAPPPSPPPQATLRASAETGRCGRRPEG
ncbi:hypothetical protein C1701_17020 [Actinoalloteichus sp. AHMU CJ021]|nr:hypothetical protein C1701_17020 [Actinoalloteichus sp. AHMU CJ021]